MQSKHRLVELLDFGQSYWLDNLSREKIQSGELNRRIKEEGLRGITSNPNIFNKAISGSNSYDSQITELVQKGCSLQEIYDGLTVSDIQQACHLLEPVYNESGGTDGFVSLEISPYMAHDTDGTIMEARRLANLVNRPNCMIKIPATKEGLPAIEQMLYEGVNINITLIFSIGRYIEVAKAYLHAMRRRVSEDKPINGVHSVASIFLSRIDTLTDQLVSQHLAPAEAGANGVAGGWLLGKAGEATARIIYRHFKEIFNRKLEGEMKVDGANLQRPLWASTSNKDPLYDDLRYVEPLIGKDTVNTLTEATIDEFAKRGKSVKDNIEQGLEEAEKVFSGLAALGIDMDFVTNQLENEGIEKFRDAYNHLLGSLADKKMKVLVGKISTQQINCGDLSRELDAANVSTDDKQVGKLLFARAPYLWKTSPAQMEEISQRLGWLNLPDHFEAHTRQLEVFAKLVAAEGYTYAVLLGMGGSSLCSEVARETFQVSAGYLQLLVLDNTDPAAIRYLEENIDIGRTLFIVASKSGNTLETMCFFKYFYRQLEQKENPGDHFIAITDKDTPLHLLAEQRKFRRIFTSPQDVGGRYSVLSDFGLVPMALMGIDLQAFLSAARQMEVNCEDVPSSSNPGISLGLALGVCRKHGRDKITFVLSTSIKAFGYWVEQLLAESTGKEGRELVPVNGESLGDPSSYRKDRVFVHMTLAADDNTGDNDKVKALEEAGHPVIRIKLVNKMALGGEYYRWEIATAIAGVVMGVNVFNQPDVEESKKNTSRLLEGEGKDINLPGPNTQDNLSFYAGKKVHALLRNIPKSAGDAIGHLLNTVEVDNYVALLPFFFMTPQRNEVMQSWRLQIRDRFRIATTLLEGPRYLHSTGQLHKGGPNTGIFIMLVGEGGTDMDIPGEKYGFETFHRAQALGDFHSLNNKDRRVILVNMGKDIDRGLENLIHAFLETGRHQTQKT